MKKGLHPDYHPVVFRDIGADYSFLTRSTATSNQTVKWEDGNEYPLINIDISSKSHPFYTGVVVAASPQFLNYDVLVSSFRA